MKSQRWKAPWKTDKSSQTSRGNGASFDKQAPGKSKRREREARRALYRRLIALRPRIDREFGVTDIDPTPLEVIESKREADPWLWYQFKDIDLVIELKFSYQGPDAVYIYAHNEAKTEKLPRVPMDVSLGSKDDEIADEFVKKATEIRETRLDEKRLSGLGSD